MTTALRNLAILSGILLLLVLVAATPPAQASLTLRIDDPDTARIDLQVVDEGMGDLAAGRPGQVLYNGAVGDFIVVVTTAMSKPILGGDHNAKLDMVSVLVSGGAGSLVFSLTDTDYSLLTPESGRFFLESSVDGSTQGSVTLQSYLDFANNPFGTGATSITTGVQGTYTGPGTFSDLNRGLYEFPGGTSAPFSLTQTVIVTHTSLLQTSNFHILTEAHAPEPAAIVVWSLLSSLGLTSVWLRRRAASTVGRAS